ncbi:uncharacterized protein LOC113190127 [Urocitellus parryii]
MRKQGLTELPTLALNLCSSCISLRITGNIAVHHCTQPENLPTAGLGHLFATELVGFPFYKRRSWKLRTLLKLHLRAQTVYLALCDKRLPEKFAQCQQNTFQDSQQRRQRVQDPGLCLERNSVMAETTAFVLLGVKTSAVLAPLQQNQV